ncbi:MAG: XdhC family protein [Candidatus Poribacteria bacterium]|nr:XdhC family protein [Candidatus Poribacteria bacterium]
MTAHDALSFWETTASLLKDGNKVFIALVADHTKHSPGTTGAKMLIAKNHDLVGTIGGGIMEHKLINRAFEIFEQDSFKPELQKLVHRKTGGNARSGMICAGEQTNLYLVCKPEIDGHTIEKIAALTIKNASGKLTISPTGLAVEEKPPNPNYEQYTLTMDRGNWLYEEELLNFKRIAIIGGGHCSLALSRIMKDLGYHVSVFETRSDVSTIGKNNYAHTIQIVDDYSKAAVSIPYPGLTYVVVMTTDVASDVRGVLGTLTQSFSFVGIMGSQAKIVEIKTRLKNEGISDDQLSQLIAPVGIPMLSNTPEEIAVSVAAQILQYKNREAG